MFGKVILALLVSMAFLLPPNALPAPKCCANPESHQVTIADGCCAATPCCIISGDSAQQPTTPAPSAGAFATAPAPAAVLVSLIVLPTNPHWVRLAKAPPRAHSPPPLALLCTYLI